ncbi:MAG: hypothetical protein ABJL71_18940 [Cyclobacteriaceae bacterium]
MSRGSGIKEVMGWTFTRAELPEPWLSHLGNVPERQWVMYVDGNDGQGKTDYIMQLSKVLSQTIGKVSLNGVEQGKHPQITESANRHHFEEIQPGKFIYERNLRDWDKYKAKMKRSRPRVMIIDSISMWPLTVKQVQELLEQFPNKIIVLVAYEAHYSQNKPIRHLCDVKVRVKDFSAVVRSRFGGKRPFIIWEEGYQAAKRKGSTGQLSII